MRKKATEPAEEPLGDALEFLQLLWEVDHGLQSMSKRMAVTFGVTGPQRLVIRIVGRHPGILAGELSDILRVHPSTLTGVLQRLELRGLVTRKRDKEDLRRVHFSLTAAGRKIDSRQAGTVESAVRRAISKLSKTQIAATRAALQVLSQELEQST